MGSFGAHGIRSVDGRRCFHCATATPSGRVRLHDGDFLDEHLGDFGDLVFVVVRRKGCGDGAVREQPHGQEKNGQSSNKRTFPDLSFNVLVQEQREEIVQGVVRGAPKVVGPHA